jgi:hypothetical protein
VCFSGFNTVEVQGKGVLSIKELQVGDYVRSSEGKFSRVYSFGHKDHDGEALYLQIHAAGLTTPIELSRTHMIYVGHKILTAQDVKVGDMLGNNKVTEIKTVKRRGIYSPVTESGDIMVSEVLASSYVAMLDYSPSLQHWAAHALASPLRLACYSNFEFCKRETYSANGNSETYILFIHVVEKLSECSAAVQLGMTAIMAPFIVAAYLLEQILLSPLLVFAAAVGVLVYKKTVMNSKVKVL